MKRPKRQLSAISILTLLCCACGDRPERIEPGSATPGPGHGTPAAVEAGPRFEGKVVLHGAAGGTQAGAVFVSARRKEQRLPSLSHKYALDDPAWSTEGENRILKFRLTDVDNMGGFGAPMAADMEVEARYDPDGFIDPTPGADVEGVVRSSVPASPGAKGLEIQLRLEPVEPVDPAPPTPSDK